MAPPVHMDRMDGSLGFSAEELLAQSAWMRRLAARLVSGEDRRAELVQDTWLAALQRPPRRVHDLRAWIAQVMRNSLRQRGRADGRRSRREQASSRPDALPSAAELVAETELQRRVTDMVLQLDEPYRSTLLLRFFRELEPTDIARRLGLPPSTIRNRLRRGLDRVRTQLDAESEGDRGRWMALLAPVAELRAPRAPVESVALKSGWITGGVLMNAKWILGVATAGLVAAVVWWPRGETPSVQPGPRAAGPADVREEPRLDSEVTAASETDRIELDGAAAEAAVAPQGAPLESLGGLVTDTEGTPLPEARVFVAVTAAINAHKEPAGIELPVDAEGRFSIPRAVRGLAENLVVEAPGFVNAEGWVAEESLTVVVLERAASLVGFVHDAASGDPLADVRVRCGVLDWRGGVVRKFLTDGAGAFEYDAVPRAGLFFLSFRRPGGVWEMRRLEFMDEDVHELEVAMERGRVLDGRVVDLETGAPIAGADVRVGDDSVATCDAEGRFTLAGFRESTTLVEVRAPGYSTTAREIELDVLGTAAVPEPFPLVAACVLEGVVLNAAGEPISGAHVIVRHERRPAAEAVGDGWAVEVPARTAFARWSTLVSVRSDEEGRFRFDSLSPFVDYTGVIARPGGGLSLTAEMPEFPDFEGPRDKRWLELRAPSETGDLLVRLTLDGEPATGNVRWSAASSSGAHSLDGSGRHSFRGIEAGPVHLRVFEGVQNHTRELDDVVAVGEELVVDVDITARAGRIAGRVVRHDGTPFAEEWIWDPSGSQSRTDEQGRFEIAVDGEEGDLLELRLLHGPNWFEFPDASVGATDVEIRLPQLGRLRLIVTGADGTPILHPWVGFRSPGEEAFRRLHGLYVRADTDGAVALELPVGPHDLEVGVEGDAWAPRQVSVTVPAEATGPAFEIQLSEPH